MKIEIAGFNLDKTLFNNDSVKTPETISAAYARISRSTKSVTELRKQALDEVAKARKSNESIIYDLGHSSIAEHAVFNIDIIGVSRLLSEIIQKSRLASFTEKSQRYVTMKGDFVVPYEIIDTPLESRYIEFVENLNNLYEKLYKKAAKYLEEIHFEGSKRELLGKAKEDARYVLPLSTETQMGMTINARSLEHLLLRLDRTNLDEAKELKNLLEKEVKYITPSLIKYTKADEYLSNKQIFDSVKPNFDDEQVVLLENSDNPDLNILKAIFFRENGFYSNEYFKNFTNEDYKAKYDIIFSNMRSFHSAPQEFEIPEFIFKLNISSSCYAQLKRHRLSTQIKSKYNPNNGIVLPPLLKKIDFDFSNSFDERNILFAEMEKMKSGLGNYVMTNSDKIKVLFKANLREIYHFVRLRSDKHAQWEIREVSQKIEKIVKKIAPFASSKLAGKSDF